MLLGYQVKPRIGGLNTLHSFLDIGSRNTMNSGFCGWLGISRDPVIIKLALPCPFMPCLGSP